MTARRAEPGPFTLVIEGEGTVNGTSFTASGRGEGDSGSGRLSFEVSLSAVADGTDPFANILSLLILPTGLFGREVDGAVNLLSLAAGDFGFRQLLTGDGIASESHGRLARTADREFTWSSAVEGQVDLPRVTEIEPFTVVMLPGGLGRLIETIEWPLLDGDRRRRVHAIRHFTFEPVTELAEHQLRDVTVAPQVDGLTVRLDIEAAVRRLTAARDR